MSMTPEPLLTRAAQALRLRLADGLDAVRGRRDPYTPPRRLAGYVGNTDFQATGEAYREYFHTLAGLRAGDRVLDIGCGIGRMARVLVSELRPPGSYDGFDVVADGIAWCQAHYTGTPVPFRFHHADLHNAAYNPGGTQLPEAYTFPFADASFDLAVATSLFTHVLPATAARYLAEVARVLAPGGRLFATWMLLPCSGPPEGMSWLEPERIAAISDPDVPEAAVAYQEPWLRQRLAADGLVLHAIDPGSWSGPDALHLQDLVVAHRRP